MMNRRDLLAAAGGATLAASLTNAAAAARQPTPPAATPPDYRIGPFAVGCQAYTFHRFSVMEAIEKTAAAGGKVIEFYPGQRLSPEEPEAQRWDQNAGDEAVEKVKEKLAKHGLLAVNFGVVGLPNNEPESRKVFAFAKEMGIRTVTTEPSEEAMDLIERLAKEYDIRVAIHNHPRQPGNPNYKVWDPRYVRSLVEKRDRRIGACADTGHWVRSGVRPIAALRILRGRVLSSHLKDLHEFSPRGHDVPFGTGVSDIKGILDELRAQRFDGNISIEYEHNVENNLAEVAQCIGFVRGYAAVAASPQPRR